MAIQNVRYYIEPETMNTMQQFPVGWDERRVRRVLAHYLTQSEEEAVAEDEEAFENEERAVVEVPVELVPIVRELVTQYASTAAGDGLSGTLSANH